MNAEETVRWYDEILELTRMQRQAIEDGDLQRLLSLLAHRGTLLASLPAELGGDRWQSLRRQIAELDSANEASLRCLSEQVTAQLGALQRGRMGLDGYQAGAQIDRTSIDRIS